MFFFFNEQNEQNLIQIIHKYYREEFALIRMTYTMLNKSTIDASENIKSILEQYNVVDYSRLERGKKYKKNALIIHPDGITEETVSYYHPNAKKHKSYGDPRFWIYKLKSLVIEGTLIYFTVFEGKLVAIPLVEHDNFEQNLIDVFGYDDTDEGIVNELLAKVRVINSRGWIESISPHRIINGVLKSAPKDAGDTFERLVGISPNNLGSADYKGIIELKSRRLSTNNKDTLFSKVPDWDISPITSSADMILKYGYPSNKEKYRGFIDLYVTVNNKPNNQGLYLFSNDNSQLLTQYYKSNPIIYETANWRYSTLKKALYDKHPKTLWIIVDEKIIDGKIHFKYLKAQLTQKPIFAQFTSLINQGIVTYDWRGRVLEDGTKYKDKGHAFRISDRYRHLLFGETKKVDF